jgi:tRNA(fMet)-specific endonuclease VapC
MLIALDTDVFADAMFGDSIITERLGKISIAEQSLPVVVVEEVVRGRLGSIRQAEAGRGKMKLDIAYDLFRQSIEDANAFIILPLTSAVIMLVDAWKRQRIRVATHDMQIAAICIVHGATLVTRNRRDYEKIPGLTFEVWN